jgi:hypothetical protein
MSVKEYVKILLAKECMTLKELARIATENSNKKYTLDGLSHKLGRGTLDFEDFELFCKLLGYEIELRKIEKI